MTYKFTKKAEKAIEIAEKTAIDLGHNYDISLQTFETFFVSMVTGRSISFRIDFLLPH